MNNGHFSLGGAAGASHEQIQLLSTMPLVPASHAQKRLWFIHQLDKEATAYTESLAFRIWGKLNILRLSAAISAMVSRHEVFRTAIIEHEGEVWQAVMPESQFEIEVVDVCSFNHAVEHATEKLRIPFDLESPPLIRASLFVISENESLLSIAIHHVACDGRSIEIILGEIAEGWNALAGGKTKEFPDAVQYQDYSRWHENWLSSNAACCQRAAWSKRFENPPPALNFMRDCVTNPGFRNQGGSVSFMWDEELQIKLKGAAAKSNTSLFAYLLSVFQVTVCRYSMQDDIVVGVPMAARGRPEFNDTVGFFANTLPVRCSVPSNSSFAAVLKDTSSAFFAALENQDIPLDLIVEDVVGKRGHADNSLFQTIFVMQNPVVGSLLPLRGLETELCRLHTGTAKMDLTVSLDTHDGHIIGELEYNSSLFDEDWAKGFVKAYENILRCVVDQPETTVSAIPMMTVSEQTLLAEEINKTHSWTPPDGTLLSLFEKSVAAFPEAIAVDSEREQTTYAVLDRQTTILAACLRGRGIGPGAVVALLMDRSLDVIVSLLAIIKTGAAFVPLDKKFPLERVMQICSDVKPCLILTDSPNSLNATSLKCEISSASALFETAIPDFSVHKSVTDDTAYIYYTSGSTGTPKGVIIDQTCALTRLAWLHNNYQLYQGDAVLYKCPLVFDVAIWEILLPLMAGAKIVVAAEGFEGDPFYLRQLFIDKKIVLAHFVPSFLDAYLDVVAPTSYPSLRWVVLSGEAVPTNLPAKFFSHFDCELHNQYGQTETSEVAVWVANRHQRKGSVPIGKQVGAYRLFIFDSGNNLVPSGVPGELCVAGEGGLARGYHNRPELTDERFVQHPFSLSNGERLYRTGDLARRSTDGLIEYLGRSDQQRKIRGCRVEPGEIEAVLRTHSGVPSCVVDIRSDEVHGQYVAAYFTGYADPSALSEHAAEHLPGYMQPIAYVRLNEPPRTASGKIDRAALPAPLAGDFLTEHGSIPPETTVEVEIADLWGALLGVDGVGRDDDFFALGGSSLKAVYALKAIEDVYDIRISVRSFFANSTVKALARLIEESIEQFIAGLTDDEVAALLKADQ